MNSLPSGWRFAEQSIGINFTVLSFALGMAFLTTLLSGLAPAAHGLQGNLQQGMISAGKGLSGDFRHAKLRSALVVTEIALAFSLLISSGLMVRTVIALTKVDLGFDPTNVTYAMLATPVGRYDRGAQKKLLIRPILDRLSSTPGVLAVAQATSWPPLGGLPGTDEVTVQHRGRRERWAFSTTMVSEHYAETLGLNILRGRWMSAAHLIFRHETRYNQRIEQEGSNHHD